MAQLPPVKFGVCNTEQTLPSLTPYDVSLCFLIKGYLCPDSEDPGGAWPQRQALGDSLLTCIRQKETVRQPTLEQLKSQLEEEVTRNLQSTKFPDQGEYASKVFECLVRRMKGEGLEDQLVALFHTLSLMVTTSTNARAEESVGADDNSVMGFFLRRCWCDFTVLPFEGVCTLARACVAYVGGGAEQGGNGNGSAIPQPPSASQPLLPVPPPQTVTKTSTFRSQIGTERFLSARTAAIAAQAGPQSLNEMASPLRELKAVAPNLLGLHLGLAMEALALGDARAAIEELHTFSNCTADPHVKGVGGIACGEAPLQPRNLLRLQLSALNLSAMHARLGQVATAMDALGEAVRSGQQAGDNACLAHALAVLCQTMEVATPGTTQLQGEAPPGASPAEAHVAELGTLLRRCLQRSEELGLPHLAGYARLGIARHALLHPMAPQRDDVLRGQDTTSGPSAGSSGGAARAGRGGFPPTAPCAAAAEISAALRYTHHLHLAAALTAAIPVAPAANSGLACLRILKGLGELFTATPVAFGPSLYGSQLACSAEVAHQARAALVLRSAGWQVFGSRRLAQAHALTFLKASSGHASAADACIALAQLAISVAERHGFEAAKRVLDAGQRRYPNAQDGTPLYAARLTIQHMHAVHRNDVRDALYRASKLIALASADDSKDIGYRIDGEEAAARALLAGGHLAQAERAAREVFSIADSTYHPIAALRALVLIARIHLQAGAWSSALPYAASALVQYRDMHADLLGAEAALVMAGIWRQMGKEHLNRAKEEVEAALPVILGHGGLDLKGRARVALVEILMGLEETKAGISAQSEELLLLLEQAGNDFMKLGDRQQAAHLYYLNALIYDACGDTIRRDKSSMLYFSLKKKN